MLYSDKYVIKYKQLPQTQKKWCKKTVHHLLKINGINRTSAALGQWFAEPGKVEGFKNLSKETILYIMHLSLMLVSEQLIHENRSNIFSNFFNI